MMDDEVKEIYREWKYRHKMMPNYDPPDVSKPWVKLEDAIDYDYMHLVEFCINKIRQHNDR